MIQVCQKCGKEYEPKRRGGKFCSTSCRVVKHQLVKRGRAWTNPTTADEQYLAEKLVAVGKSAQEVLTFVEGLPAEVAITAMRQLVEGWVRVANNSIIDRIQYHQQQELKAQAARTKRARSTRSVSTERKPEPLA
jgi:hypothetical protein